jgi:hypothetical protein
MSGCRGADARYCSSNTTKYRVRNRRNGKGAYNERPALERRAAVIISRSEPTEVTTRCCSKSGAVTSDYSAGDADILPELPLARRAVTDWKTCCQYGSDG